MLDLTSSSRKDMTTASDRAAFEIIEDALSDRYRILACTRGKGMSGLYEAEDVVLRRKVGIKCVFFDASAHPRFWRRRRHDFIERPKSRPSSRTRRSFLSLM